MINLPQLNFDILSLICQYLSFEDLIALRICDKFHHVTFTSEEICRHMLWLYDRRLDGTRMAFDRMAISRRRFMTNRPTRFCYRDDLPSTKDFHVCKSPSSNIIAYWSTEKDIVLLHATDHTRSVKIIPDFRSGIAFTLNSLSHDSSTMLSRSTPDIIQDGVCIASAHERLLVAIQLKRDIHSRVSRLYDYIFLIISTSEQSLGHVLHCWNNGPLNVNTSSQLADLLTRPELWLVNQHYVMNGDYYSVDRAVISLQHSNMQLSTGTNSSGGNGWISFTVKNEKRVNYQRDPSLMWRDVPDIWLADECGDLAFQVKKTGFYIYDLRKIVHAAPGEEMNEDGRTVCWTPLLAYCHQQNRMLAHLRNSSAQWILMRLANIYTKPSGQEQIVLRASDGLMMLSPVYAKNSARIAQDENFYFHLPYTVESIKQFILTHLPIIKRHDRQQYPDRVTLHDDIHGNQYMIEKGFYYSVTDAHRSQDAHICWQPISYTPTVEFAIKSSMYHTEDHGDTSTLILSIVLTKWFIEGEENRQTQHLVNIVQHAINTLYESSIFKPASIRSSPFHDPLKLLNALQIGLSRTSMPCFKWNGREHQEPQSRRKSLSSLFSKTVEKVKEDAVLLLPWKTEGVSVEKTGMLTKSTLRWKESMPRVWVGDGGGVNGGWVAYVIERERKREGNVYWRKELHRKLVIVNYD